MKRFVITVLVATFFHAIACILIPPFEFAPTRPACFFWAMRSSLVAFTIAFALLLLPLRIGLRRFLPRSTPQTQAVVAGVVLFIVVSARTLVRQLSGEPAAPYEHGYLCQWIFWPLLVVAVVISFFWPFGAPAAQPEQAVPMGRNP